MHDQVFLRRIEEKEEVKGGIIIPDTAKEKPMEGIVQAKQRAERRASGGRQTGLGHVGGANILPGNHFSFHCRSSDGVVEAMSASEKSDPRRLGQIARRD
jgi:co-chaperonin GroES (HSP10)